MPVCYDRSMKIVQVTDTHIRADPTVVHWGYRPHASLSVILEAIKRDHADVDFLICTGDCVHAYPEEPDAAFRGGEEAGYLVLRKLLTEAAPATTLLHALPGNHDSREFLGTVFPQSRNSVLPLPSSPPGVHCFGVLVKGWLMLGCDTQSGPPTDPNSHGAFGEAQFQWLRACLTACSSKPTIIFMHHPPVAHEGCFDADSVAEFEQILVEHNQQVKAVVAGHIHNDFTIRLCGGSGPPLLACPSCVFQFHVDPDGKVGKQDFVNGPGYRVINCTVDAIDMSAAKKPMVVRPPLPPKARLPWSVKPEGPRMAHSPWPAAAAGGGAKL